MLDIAKAADPNVSAGPKTEADLYRWTATISGPIGSPYEGGAFVIDITIPSDYPFSGPEFIFETPVFHPNFSGGSVCVGAWSAAQTIAKALAQIRALLASPNLASPLDTSIAAMCASDPARFEATAREWTSTHATRSTSATVTRDH
eukprot:a844098_250.p1 GENE.a844098_250~~a844098_250.p1  ORF type:complete len:167 (-),score=16.20 a844098_250:66-503(-)